MLAVIAASLSAAVLTAAVAPGWFGAADKATPTVSSRPDAPAERAPTAMRLYVLPSLSVVAERKSELAKIEREDKADVFQPAARWKGWARPRA